MQSLRHLMTPFSLSTHAEKPVMICLLGSFAVLQHGDPLPVRSGGKTEALLSTLALRCRHRVPREVVLAEVWPDAEPDLARQALHSLLHGLRRLLAPALHSASPILSTQGGYHLNRDAGVGVDFDCFDELAELGDDQAANDVPAAVEYYERAISLYGGDLLGGDQQTAIVERERLRARHLTLLIRSASYHYEQGDVELCLQLAQRLLEHDPCREDAHRLVMRCHVLRGERAQALRQFRLCAQILRSEFDAEPEPATVALYDQVRLHPDAV
jgi:DNA-binding SARP family transcriptional activator